MIPAAVCVLLAALSTLAGGLALLCGVLWGGSHWLAEVVVLQAGRIAELERTLDETQEALAEQHEAAEAALLGWHRAEVRLLDAEPVFVHGARVDA